MGLIVQEFNGGNSHKKGRGGSWRRQEGPLGHDACLAHMEEKRKETQLGRKSLGLQCSSKSVLSKLSLWTKVSKLSLGGMGLCFSPVMHSLCQGAASGRGTLMLMW